MSSTALPPPSPYRLVGRVARLSPLFMVCIAAMGGAYVAGRNARLSIPPTAVPASAPQLPAQPVAPLRGALSDARDLECLTQAVYYEARGEPESGQAAVAQVVLNRTRAGRYPKSVCGVVFQHAPTLGRIGCQFSFACDRRIARPREREAWSRAERVARAALSGRRAVALPPSTTQFRVAGLSSEGLQQVARIGAHVFYRLGHPTKPATSPDLAAAPTPERSAPEKPAPGERTAGKPAPETVTATPPAAAKRDDKPPAPAPAAP